MNKQAGLLAACLSFCNLLCAQETLQTVMERGNRYYDATLDQVILGLGRGTTSAGQSTYIGWRYNGGAQYGYVDTYQGGAPLVLQPTTGNVGVGLTAPVYKLDVNGTISSINAAGASPYIIRNPGSLNRWSFGIGNNETGSGNTGYDFRLVRWNDAGAAFGAPLFIRRSNGFMGINNENPQFQLDVNGAGNFVNGVNAGGAGNTTYNTFKVVRSIGGADYTVQLGVGAAGGAAITAQQGTNNRVILLRSAQTYPEYSPDGGNTLYPIWHAGNFSPSGYLPLTGGSITGEVNIGANTAQKNLNVNGVVKTRKVIVTQTGWSDYVFDSSYQLQKLSEVEAFILKNKHLPDVPSAATVDKEGIDVGDSQALLLKKIEELTLYIIQQNKEIKAQQEEMKELRQEVKALKNTKVAG